MNSFIKPYSIFMSFVIKNMPSANAADDILGKIVFVQFDVERGMVFSTHRNFISNGCSFLSTMRLCDPVLPEFL